MEIAAGVLVKMKKPHPCGSYLWEVLRTGQDFRLKCATCGRQVMMKRAFLEKQVKEVLDAK